MNILNKIFNMMCVVLFIIAFAGLAYSQSKLSKEVVMICDVVAPEYYVEGTQLLVLNDVTTGNQLVVRTLICSAKEMKTPYKHDNEMKLKKASKGEVKWV